MLAVCGGLSACATSGNTTATASLAPTTATVPALPESVTAIPSFSPGSTEDGMRSLAHEVETNAGMQPAAYAAPAGNASLAAVQKQGASGIQIETVPVPPGVEATVETAEASKAVERPTVEQPGNSIVETVVQTPVDAAKVTLASLGNAVGSLPERLGRSVEDSDNAPPPPEGRLGPVNVEARSPELDQLMKRYADYYDVPEELVRRVAKRESTFNPKARNGRYLGLMQISHATARGMGYRGPPAGLLDAETNLKYAVRYLRGAYIVGGRNHSVADRLYQSGYYYHAKRAGLLDETGLGNDRKRRRRI